MVLVALAITLSAPAAALEGRLLLPDGRAAAQHEVAVVGRSGAVRTDVEGHFRLVPDPVPPFTLLVTSPDGEFYSPIEVSSLGARLDATLVPAYRESLTVASGIAPGLEAPPAAGTVLLGREDLEQRRPQHVADALSGVAGSSITGEGPDAVPVLRGMARGRTLILIDGGRVTTERRAGPSATFYDPFAAGTVEVARGPGSVAYGSDAFGGVIDVRSPDPDIDRRTLRYDAASWRGGREENAAGVQASTPLGDGALLGQIHAREAEDGESGRRRADPQLVFPRPRRGAALPDRHPGRAPPAGTRLEPGARPRQARDRLGRGAQLLPGGELAALQSSSGGPAAWRLRCPRSPGLPEPLPAAPRTAIAWPPR